MLMHDNCVNGIDALPIYGDLIDLEGSGCDVMTTFNHVLNGLLVNVIK